MNKIANKISLTTLVIVVQILFVQFTVLSNEPLKDNTPVSKEDIKVSIIYDNYVFKEGMKSDWGFSCLIEGTEKTILFDAGTKKDIFKQNFEALNMDANKIEFVVISHDHFDHIGGLETVLQMNNNVSVYMLKDFANKVKNIVTKNNGKLVFEPKVKEICKNVYLSGTLGDNIKEQSIAISTSKGLVVITGCSHPGINEILEHFKSSLSQEIYMVFGGFHLMRKNDSEMAAIIDEMKSIGVQKCGATHCTGKKQINLFKEAFDENYVQMGVGNVIKL